MFRLAGIDNCPYPTMGIQDAGMLRPGSWDGNPKASQAKVREDMANRGMWICDNLAAWSGTDTGEAHAAQE